MRYRLNWKPLVRLKSKPPLSMVMFLIGCVLIVLLDLDRSHPTWLQMVVGFIGVFIVEDWFAGNRRFVGVSLLSFPSLTVLWLYRKHLTDSITLLLITILLGCMLWAYVRGSLLWNFLSLCIFSLIALPIVWPIGRIQYDRLRSMVLILWIGVFLWAWNFAPSDFPHP